MRRVVIAVTEHHTDGIFPVTKLSGNIESHVLRLFVEFRPGRIQEVIADLFSIEKHFELPEPADIGHRTLDRLGSGKLTTQLGQFVRSHGFVKNRTAVFPFACIAFDALERIDVRLHRDPFRPVPILHAH